MCVVSEGNCSLLVLATQVENNTEHVCFVRSQFLKSFRIPMLVLGGGGYSLRHTASAWTYSTAALLEQDVPNELPDHEYLQYYGPNYTLHPDPLRNMDCLNTLESLQGVVAEALQNIKVKCKRTPLDCAPLAFTVVLFLQLGDPAPAVNTRS